MRIRASVALFALLIAVPASAGFKVKFDCYLPAGNVTCQTLRESYFHALPFLVQTDSQPELLIKVRTLGTDHKSTRYIFIFEGKGDAPDMTLIDDANLAKTSAAVALQLLTDLQKLTYPYLDAPTPGATDEYGNFTLTVADPHGTPQSADAAKTTGWYLSNSIYGHISAGGNTDIYGEARSDVNYSDKSWRFRASGGGSYRKVIVDLGDEKESQETVAFNGKTLIVRAIKERWSIAALLSAAYDPNLNQDFNGQTSAGLEWNLVPFLTTNDKNASVRYQVNLNYHNYVSPNLLDETEKVFLSHALGAYFTWLFEDVDLNSGIFADSIVNDLRFSNLGAEFGISWQVTDRFNVGASINGSYRHALINTPKEENIEDPLEQYLNGGNYSQFTHFSMLSLTYTFGNSVLQLQDQRWKRW